ncbi:hypothetical protein P13BB106kb_p014 [Pectobacterium phage DU_PP_V]|uniref:Uncharacterized protein n=1 Tax=Pectobacterium phage DU_PP_V TaxID=2041492 RepID=A0A2D2W6S8_9CAUD|nr:hypothetical protein HOS40_gp014 [Pectobacterium phage DU_PP_V]ATS93998.1 hypothetical protein P13BB106kb_p014 [Pectobacterium phage DU_PP_V]
MRVIQEVTLKFVPLEGKVTDLPVGHYVVIMAGDRREYMEVINISNGRLAIVNGHFYFDMANVTHYAVWPE